MVSVAQRDGLWNNPGAFEYFLGPKGGIPEAVPCSAGLLQRPEELVGRRPAFNWVDVRERRLNCHDMEMW